MRRKVQKYPRLAGTAFVIFVVLGLSLLAFGSFAGSHMSRVPDAARTYFLTVYWGRGASAGGYVEPWIGNAYHYLFLAALGSFAFAMVAALPRKFR